MRRPALFTGRVSPDESGNSLMTEGQWRKSMSLILHVPLISETLIPVGRRLSTALSPET